MTDKLIATKMAAVMADTAPVEKNGVNSQQGFKFRSIDDTVHSVRKALVKHGVAVVPSTMDTQLSTYQTKSGMVMNVATVTVDYTFFAEDGSSVTATMVGQAADSGDKAVSKALSMAFKYLCFQTFLCGTDGDPDGEVAPEAVSNGLTQADKTRLTALGKKYGLEKDAFRATIQDAIGREISSPADLTKADMNDIEAYLAEMESAGN